MSSRPPITARSSANSSSRATSNAATTIIDAILDEYVDHGQELPFLRVLARMIRNLLFSELIVAGDFGDRGPRIDKVIEYVMRQPNVALVWGNHDASWMGACLGQEACIANVLRMSLRYQRLFQLEMGYGIPMAALEKLVRTSITTTRRNVSPAWAGASAIRS